MLVGATLKINEDIEIVRAKFDHRFLSCNISIGFVVAAIMLACLEPLKIVMLVIN